MHSLLGKEPLLLSIHLPCNKSLIKREWVLKYIEIPIGMGVRNGNQFYFPDPYPNSVNWSVFFPTHYDPLAE